MKNSLHGDHSRKSLWKKRRWRFYVLWTSSFHPFVRWWPRFRVASDSLSRWLNRWRKAKVVLLDEPTAALGVAQTRQVLNLILRLRDQGLGVVVISHNLADVFEVADRVIVLRLGKRVATFDVKNTTSEQVVAAITGAEFGELMSSGGNGASEGR